MKAIVLAGSRGIGAAVCAQLKSYADELVATSTKSLDTSDMAQVHRFCAEHPRADVLVLNTGGPPAIPIAQITEEQWYKYFNQLFLSFVVMMNKVTISDGGFVFLISSFNVKEPDPKLVLSNSLRIAFVSFFKSMSKLNMERGVSYINIAPGPTRTDRLQNLVEASGKTMDEFVQSLPSRHVIDPAEIGRFVRFVVESRSRALNGVTINFDMGLSNYVL